jgi:hypothetical protein
MPFHTLIIYLDAILCRYLGLEKEQVKPESVELVDNELIISNTTSFKRHSYKENWQQFSESALGQTDPAHLEKLGVAMGKALAKDLLISFEEAPIDRV